MRTGYGLPGGCSPCSARATELRSEPQRRRSVLRYIDAVRQKDHVRRRGRPCSRQHFFAKLFRVDSSWILKCVLAPRRQTTLVDRYKSRQSIKHDAESAAHECALAPRHVPGEGEARRQVIEIVLAMPTIQITLQLGARCNLAVIQPGDDVVVVQDSDFRIVPEAGVDYQAACGMPFVVDETAGHPASLNGGCIGGGLGVYHADTD